MPSRVLVVDGSRAMRRILSRKLETLGIDTVEAASSNQALAKLNQHRISLITTALLLPDEDGLAFIKAARENHLYAQTPIFVVSSDKRVCTELDPRDELHISQVIDKSKGLDYLIQNIVDTCESLHAHATLAAG
ncbi:MAG: response regulator [bacterium]